ncbi:hypothetical protein PGH12_10570 [Chryseobacterium wangxinyae]|uniref:hypothetical protein n=1 Tax=Chryseobacterium sp. CY350 TaxID=2997336 RepID=UPI00226F82A7|nr:hypothetical protein [Chryseobacterium sp. CY350]MCY0978699.1 hypothetical protein [Chryseobacterium sp. CY350]WBZ93920.1 hypothetical protein PGH12_10570 [Chryseobacterium sp. CY350]
MHLDSVSVTEADANAKKEVHAGTVLGYAGVSGSIASGGKAPHLHLEIATVLDAYGHGESVRTNPARFVALIQKASDDFAQWKGNYYANFEISRAEGDFQIKYTIRILSIDDISIIEKINNEDNNIQDIFIESVSADKIVFKSKSDKNLEYIVSKIKGAYYLMGSTIYLLNPPNDKYLLKK